MSKIVTENKIDIIALEKHENPKRSVIFYNPVMKINREFVLSSLGAYCVERTGETTCLDAFGATGIAGLQWKRHLKFPVSITINDNDAICAQAIKDNCERNGFKVNVETEGINAKRDVGDEENEAPSLNCPIDVTHEDANVLLHKRQFNFIHVDPFGSTVQYMESLFRNVYHKGMVIITSTDIAALYGKCPQVTRRNYSAYTVRTDYTKEMAVRILLAEAARCAAKCNKGFEVKYSLAVEHFVQVGLKIKRGANHGNQCVSQISQFLHCRHCQEWGQLPQFQAPVEKPYTYLPCTCYTEHPGQTALVLGPMWNGEIFNIPFLQTMLEKATDYKLSEKAISFLTDMICEAECNNKDVEQSFAEQKVDVKQTTTTENTMEYDTTSIPQKRTISQEDKCENGTHKKVKTARSYGDHQTPIFYYNLHRRRIKNVDVPKAAKLISKLQKEGYRASKTHFDSQGIRTSACLQELTEILQRYFSQKTD